MSEGTAPMQHVTDALKQEVYSTCKECVRVSRLECYVKNVHV